MGWKSTIEINRSEAKELIVKKLMSFDKMTNRELEELLESIGYGDDVNLRYYGYNFKVVNDDEDIN